MSAALASTTTAPIDVLKAQLDDPVVAAALGDILQHADLLSILVVGLDGFISRSEVIGDELASSFGDLAEIAESPEFQRVNPREIASSVVKLSAALPTLARMADSGLLDSLIEAVASAAVVEQLSIVTKGVADGLTADPVAVSGPLSLLRQLKDPDISRGMGFGLALLKSIGAELNSPRPTDPQ